MRKMSDKIDWDTRIIYRQAVNLLLETAKRASNPDFLNETYVLLTYFNEKAFMIKKPKLWGYKRNSVVLVDPVMFKDFFDKNCYREAINYKEYTYENGKFFSSRYPYNSIGKKDLLINLSASARRLEEAGYDISREEQEEKGVKKVLKKIFVR